MKIKVKIQIILLHCVDKKNKAQKGRVNAQGPKANESWCWNHKPGSCVIFQLPGSLGFADST